MRDIAIESYVLVLQGCPASMVGAKSHIITVYSVESWDTVSGTTTSNGATCHGAVIVLG